MILMTSECNAACCMNGLIALTKLSDGISNTIRNSNKKLNVNYKLENRN